MSRAAREELVRLRSQLKELRRELHQEEELWPLRDRVENKLLPTLEAAQEELGRFWDCPLCHSLFPEKEVEKHAAGAGIPCPLCEARKRLEEHESFSYGELGRELTELLAELELLEEPSSTGQRIELCREGLELLQEKRETPSSLWGFIEVGRALQSHSFRSELASLLQSELSEVGRDMGRDKAFSLAHRLASKLEERARKHRREEIERNDTFKLGRGVLEAAINEGLYEVEEAPGWEELLGLVERALELYRKQPGLLPEDPELEALELPPNSAAEALKQRLRELEESLEAAHAQLNHHELALIGVRGLNDRLQSVERWQEAAQEQIAEGSEEHAKALDELEAAQQRLEETQSWLAEQLEELARGPKRRELQALEREMERAEEEVL